jgi:hypothetical protein
VRALVRSATRAEGLSALPQVELVEGDMALPEALSMADVAEKLSAATGKRIEYINVAPEEATRAQLAAGKPPFTADALAELFAEQPAPKV